MKKTLLKASLMMLLFLVGGGNAALADTTSAKVKMTYVDYNNPETSFGEITSGNTAKTGYNNISGGKVGFANTGWNCNWITYLQVDASDVEGTITKVQLKFDASGSTDSKRTTGVGAGYNSSTWSSTMTYNTADRSITTVGSQAWTSTKSSGTYNNLSIDITAAFTNDDDNIVTILLYETAAAGCYIKNPTVEVTYTNAQPANYTIKYQDGEGTELKESKDYLNGVIVGENYTASDEDMQSFTVNGIKYKYVSGNETKVAAADNNEITLVFEEAAKYTVDLQYNETTLASKQVYEGDAAVVYAPYYQFVDGELFGNPQVDKGTKSYGQVTLNNVLANTTINATYTAEANQNAVFYAEAEDIPTLTRYEDGYTQIRMSNGAVAYAAADGAVIATLPAGKYTLTSSSRAGTTNFFADDANILTLASTGAVVTTTGEEFTLTKTTDITVSAGSNKDYFDYVLIRKTGDATVSCNVSAAGYATFSSEYALDLDNMTEGFTAYKVASVGVGVVTTEQVTGKVAANTGLIIKGNAGTCTIPVSAEAGVAPENLLVAVTADNTEITAGNYVLGVDNEEVKFLLVDDVLPKLNAGKAYLAPSTPVLGRALRFVEGEANGINDVNVEAVAAPAKYIVNGKLVIEKAGKMFNAAGAQIK